MFRYEHMPSDFHPMFLIIGERADLERLAGLLRLLARDAAEIDVTERLREFTPRARLRLERAADDFGMHERDGGFTWRLNAWQAEQIAARIDALADPDAKSGSDIFEVGSEGEIPVKVSRGEFTEDFLISKR